MTTLRRRLALLLAPNSEAAAEARWTANNRRAREAGCPCGKPATEVRYDDRVAGNVPRQVWTCAEHRGMSGASRQFDGYGNVTEFEAYWRHPRPCPYGDVRGESGPIGGPSTSFDCPHRTHDPEEVR